MRIFFIALLSISAGLAALPSQADDAGAPREHHRHSDGITATATATATAGCSIAQVK